MVNRIDVIALKPLSLGGINYRPGEPIAMGEGRVRQYELIAKRTGQAVIRRAVETDATAPANAPARGPRPPHAEPITPKPTPPAPPRPAALVNPDPPRGYRNRRLKTED